MLKLLALIKRYISARVCLYVHKYKWRIANQHNSVQALSVFPIEKVVVGRYTYGGINALFYGTVGEHISIGSFCSIANGTVFIASGGHDYECFSSFPFKTYVMNETKSEATIKGPISIKDDVWLGYGCMILSGVEIGQGAVIAAGSVVAKNIPPYAIFAGGKVVGYRFPEPVIAKLLLIDFDKISHEALVENIDLMYRKMGTAFFDTDFYQNITRGKP